MTLTQKRKIKNFIATIIAYTLIVIAIFIKCIIPATIVILIVIATHLTYEEFRQGMIVVSIIGAIIAVIKLLKENERSKNNEEYKTANNIDFIEFGQAKINVTLTASMKNLKEQAKGFVDKIVDDLNLIETQEHKAEILVEYKQTLNVSNAITTVTNRFKAIEEEKKKQEEFIKEASKAVIVEAKDNPYAPQNQETLQAPVEEKQEDILTVNFKVKGTRAKLRTLKEFLEREGYDYE